MGLVLVLGPDFGGRPWRCAGRKNIVAPDGSAIVAVFEVCARQQSQGACAHLTMAAVALWGRVNRSPGLGLACGVSTTGCSWGALVLVRGLGERSGKHDDCLPMFSDRDVQIVFGEVQEHPLLG